MPGLILGAYTMAPVVPVDASPWASVSAMTWAGWDGSVWPLIYARGSGVSLRRGARGLNMPPVDRYSSTSPAVAGSRNRGSRTAERQVFWPVKIFSNAGSQAWVDVDRAFWRTMDPDRPGVWSVTSVDGTTRTLTCRFVSDGDHVLDLDPMLLGWQNYGITLVAEQPYWSGAEVARRWKTAGGTPFFGGVAGGSGPPFYISSGSTMDTATISNPGDVDAYPTYTITGPTTSVSVGYAGNVVQMGVIPAGQTRTIDTRPDRLTVVDQDGTDRWSELGALAQFDAPIPPGQEVALSLELAGTGDVSASLIPLYRRAW